MENLTWLEPMTSQLRSKGVKGVCKSAHKWWATTNWLDYWTRTTNQNSHWLKTKRPFDWAKNFWDLSATTSWSNTIQMMTSFMNQSHFHSYSFTLWSTIHHQLQLLEHLEHPPFLCFSPSQPHLVTSPVRPFFPQLWDQSLPQVGQAWADYFAL